MSESRATDPAAGSPAVSARTPPASAGLLCPYCGTLQPAEEAAASNACVACRKRLDPLARIATHNAMGPWFVRDMANPFAPGCAYETLRAMCQRGRIRLTSVVRGPTTQQFWRLAAHTPGVAALLGQCHACAERVEPDAARCPACEAELHPRIAVGVGSFAPIDDRQHLGLPAVQPLPGDGTDPRAALEALEAALGHVAAPRGGGPPVPSMPRVAGGAVDGPRSGEGDRTRPLWAALVCAVALLLGLALWSVVLPAFGLRTGVEEITGLRSPVSPAMGWRGAGEGPSAPASLVDGVDRRDAAGAVVDGERSEASTPGSVLADGGAGAGAALSDDGAVDAIEPAEANVGDDWVLSALFGDALPGVDRRRLLDAHRASLSDRLSDLLALRDVLVPMLEAHPDEPGLRALAERVDARIAARRARERLGTD